MHTCAHTWMHTDCSHPETLALLQALQAPSCLQAFAQAVPSAEDTLWPLPLTSFLLSKIGGTPSPLGGGCPLSLSICLHVVCRFLLRAHLQLSFVPQSSGNAPQAISSLPLLRSLWFQQPECEVHQSIQKSTVTFYPRFLSVWSTNVWPPQQLNSSCENHVPSSCADSKTPARQSGNLGSGSSQYSFVVVG